MILKLLFFLYLINLNLNKKEFLPKQLFHFLNDTNYSHIYKHIILFLTIFSLISLLYDQCTIFDMLLYTIILYLSYIISVKTSLLWSLLILFVLLANYIFSLYYKKNLRNNCPINVMCYTENDFIIKCANIKKYYYGFIFILILISVYTYNYKKLHQYNTNYKSSKFIFGLN